MWTPKGPPRYTWFYECATQTDWGECVLGLIERRSVPRGGHEYDLIPAGEELRTWVELMAVWGQRDFPDRNRVWRVEQDGEWVESGNSAIVNPRGEFVAGPVAHEKTILLAEIDVSQVHARRRKFDSVGHYNRPDVFRLSIDASEQRAVDALNWSDKIKRELEH